MPYIHFSTPVLATNCTKSPEWHNDQLPGWNADWVIGGLSTDSKNDADCSAADEKPLLIIQRHGFANFFHSSEDFFNSYLALLITGLRPDQVQVLLADLFAWGPFESLWKHLFPNVRTAWEFRQEKPRCFRKVIIGIYGPASPLTLIARKSDCLRSPLVLGYARWVWASFGVSPVARSGGPARLLWMSRRRSVVWPERAYCDNRYVVCSEWEHLSTRPLGRVLTNDEEVVAALAGRAELNVTNADFNLIPFAEQVKGGRAGVMVEVSRGSSNLFVVKAAGMRIRTATRVIPYERGGQ
jgi:hypothetical protein